MEDSSGQYKIQECLCSSRSSIIYKAVDSQTGDIVILKTMSDKALNSKGLARLKNEYVLLSKLKSNFVPQIVDFIKIDEDFFLASKYIRGIALSQYIKTHEITIREFLLLARDIVKGLSDIHRAGIIHKDLNPFNILYDDQTGRVAIMDFGLSAEFSFEKPLMIDVAASEGTLYYISPEQTGRMNRAIDFRTDFYSLGVTFFEILCGTRPFKSESPAELIYDHVARVPVSAREVNSKVPDTISKMIAKLMAKMPEDRYMSTEGILFDLGQCITTYNIYGEIPDFELGVGDYSDRIEIPHKLYGRERELETLREAYGSISQNGRCAVFISGHSGVGKTSLVGEFQKSIVQSGGTLLSGKYEQYQRNMPHHVLFQIVRNFCDFILSESEERIAEWKVCISDALGEDAFLFTDKVERLALLIGKMQPRPELSFLETGTRFKAAIHRLLAAVASPEHPLVIFLDDIQLVSSGGMDILEESIQNENIRGLMLICCYRDNEVDSNHPVTLSLNKLVNQEANVHCITLFGINQEAVAKMLAETLHSSIESVIGLARVVYNKTLGNPFYMKQFLMICHMNGLIRFSRSKRVWVWEKENINACPAEDNVVDFIIRNMDQFSEEAIELLSFGACNGRSFSVGLLAKLSGKKSKKISEILGRPIFLEVIYPVQGDGLQMENICFQFSHDRFQQAFYTILSERNRSRIHYMLAKYYSGSESGDSGASEKRFLVANHYSKAFGMIDSPMEKKHIAQILLKAARAACLLSTYEIALGYLEQIIGHLNEMESAGDDFGFSVYAAYHLVLCSLSRYEDADRVYPLLEKLADSPIDLTDNCCLQAVGLSNRGEYGKAFMLGVELLEKLGVSFPKEMLYETIKSEVETYYTECEKMNFLGKVDKIEAVDKKESAISKILNRISAGGFFLNPLYSAWAIVTSARRSLIYGYTPEGVMLYANLTLVLVPFKNDYKLSYAIADKARRLAEKAGYKNELFRVYHVFSLFNGHWFQDVKKNISYSRESWRGNDSVGDFEFACYSYFTTQQAVLETCQTVRELAGETESALAYAVKTGNLHAVESYTSYAQLYKALKGTTKAYGSFEDDNFSEENHLEGIRMDQMAQCCYYILRALSAAIYLDYNTAYDLTVKATSLMPYITGFYLTAIHNFLHSLAICKRLEYHDCGREEQISLRAMLEANQEWLGERAADAPVNFLHLHSAIKAEIAALDGRGDKLASLYEKAIREAETSNRPYHYAMLCELAARRFLKLDAPKTAANFLREAYSAYLSWEADGKTEQLWKDSSGLLSVNYTSKKGFYRNPGTAYVSGTSSAVNRTTIDFNALITTSQAISGEIELEAILDKLMNILQEISGAQYIYYLTKDGKDGYVIRAEGSSEYKEESSVKVPAANSGCISLGILYYVDRTKETIVLNNALTSDIFMSDEHILAYGSKSILCMPIIHRGDLKGILYLENRLIEGVFDEKRLEALKVIGSQLAISLENAYLYSNLQFLVDDRTKELREEIKIRQGAEERLAHMANHDTLTGLPNRRMFQNHLEFSIKAANYEKGVIAVLFVDLDGFKSINDLYGHDAGDIVLIFTARRLVNTVRGCDMVSRLGGDEFVLVIENAESREQVEALCGQLIDAVKNPIKIDEAGTEVSVTSSIGISISGSDGNTAEELINNSDKAMYAAKNNGKNQYAFYSEL